MNNYIGVKVRVITEHIISDKRLGRHVKHDPRNRLYAYPHRKVEHKSIRHNRWIPVLDQGDLGSCTGNAVEGVLGTSPIWDALIQSSLLTLPSVSNAELDEDQAVTWYSAATSLDDYLGTYPPEDTGSDGQSAMQALLNAGYISGYQHAFDVETALTALEQGPVIIGINWYSSFDEPISDGYIAITSQAFIRGGHEVVLDEIDAENELVWLTNSWGSQWGIEGRACMSFATLKRLLSEDGDVTIPVPLTSPAPTPMPDKPAWFELLVDRLEDLLRWLRSL